ncbi:MAG TPA: ribbon-helix-helix protein, CopG family [Steroidobacteraceae bacterium]
MRTTLTLDEDVAAKLRAESRRTGRSFKVVVNEYLRAALAQRKATQAAAPFRVRPVDMGGPMPGRSYDDIEALLDDIEGDDRR